MLFTPIFLAVASVGWYMTAALPECDVIPEPQDVSANITTCSSSRFSIVISWQWPYDWSTCEGTANLVGIRLRELSTSTSVGIANIHPSTIRAIADCSVRNLKCGSLYSISMNLLGTEEFQMMTTVTILGGPSVPTVGGVSEKAIQLSWSPFSPISVCDVQPSVSYTVACHGRAHCGNETPHISTAALQETEYTFEDLEEYTNYTFNLTMYPGGMSVIIHAQTLTAAPTGKPQNVTAKNVTDMTVELIWDREDCFSRNGEITGYVVQYSKDRGSQDVMNTSIVHVEEAPSQSCTIDQLCPNTSYMFQVAAVNANGTGPFSEPYCVTTLAGDNIPTSCVSVPGPDNDSSTTDVPFTTTVGENEHSHNGGGESSTPALAVTSTVTVITVLVTGGLIVIICYQKSQIRKLQKQLTTSQQHVQSELNMYPEEDEVDSPATNVNPAYGKLGHQQQDSYLYDRVN